MIEIKLTTLEKVYRIFEERRFIDENYKDFCDYRVEALIYDEVPSLQEYYMEYYRNLKRWEK